MTDFHNPVLWLSLLPSVVFFGYIIQRYVTALRTRPDISKQDIVYQEHFASGASQKNILTKLGGARNCLRLVVTRDLLWITSWFPFSVITAVYDLAHVIPMRSISSVQSARFLGADSLILSYTDSAGGSHSLRIIPKDRELFLSAIQFQVNDPNAANVG